MNAVLLIDFGSTFTKVTAVDLENERILGTAKSFTTVNTDINEGLVEAVNILSSKIGKIEFKEKYACSSAAGGLKMIAVGLVPELTAEAAKRTALSAGAKVMKVYSYGLNKSEIEEIKTMKPDIVLLTGGTDGGDFKSILHNAKMIGTIEETFPIVVAGNKTYADKVADILIKSGKEVKITENVMPRLNELNIDSARKAIREIFLRRIIQAKGFTEVKSLIEGILMPTPSAVLKAASLLSKGTSTEEGIGELMVVDIGGATTDVHSLANGEPTKTGVYIKGLKEPFEKRSVEGDLGVRYSAKALVDALGLELVSKESKINKNEIIELIKKIEESPEIIAEEDKLKDLDFVLGYLAAKTAVERHVGTIETQYTPFGTAYLQDGKDLTNIKYVVGTGGPIINSSNSKGILEKILFEKENPTVLKPIDPEFLLDKKYILAAMGLLGEKYPEKAIRIMKKEIEKIN
ncbi:methylaspartate mutase accessory protein GlmL [Clostridium sediminicola]|uniref:methylaspartate mutase accessory protein GlmL n=1 Tax=Clostridium sediminicola TaxID=3114879 RepID=UPI0031F20085